MLQKYMTSLISQDYVTPDEFAGIMIGKPYIDRACGTDAVDCWGLIVMYYRMVHRINIQHSSSYSHGGEFSECHTEEVEFWACTNTPVRGDIVVAYVGSRPAHVALWWARDTILHAREKTFVRMDRLRTLGKLSTKIEVMKYAGSTHK